MPGFAAEVPCLDPLACNFMEEGECFFTDENGDPCVIEGCTIQGACNYDPEADIYDGSCEFESCLGCTDSEACNYDETALYDDATCIYYVDCNGTCGGDWIEDTCGNCFPPESNQQVIFEPCGINSGMYGPSQEDCDDYYDDLTVEVDDFGFQYWTVPQTASYLITAYGAQGGDGNAPISSPGGLGSVISATINLTQGDVLKIGVGQKGISGCSGGGGGSSGVSILGGDLILVAGGGGGCGYGAYTGVPATQNATLETSGQNTYSPSGALIAYGGEDGYGGQGGTNPNSGDWPRAGGGAGVLGNGGSNPYSSSYDGGGGGLSSGVGGLGSSDNCGSPTPHGGFGFTGGGGGEWAGGGGGGYSGGAGGASTNGYIYGGGGGSFSITPEVDWVNAEAGVHYNHGMIHIEWMGSYQPECNPGCTYPQACNYNPDSNFDDGSCDYCFCGEGTQWVDSLQACMITEEALMQACGEGTYWDDLAQACLTIETCQEDLDGDGIIGVNDLLELLSSFGSECVVEPETAEWTCGDPINYHDYNYNTILIGGQCWFAENLRTQNYSNGDAINTGLNGPEWANATSGAVTLYGEDPSPSCVDYSPTVDSCDPNEALPAFGRIYNWHAVGDPRGLCPAGWHVPSDNDFMELEVFMGIDADEVQGSGWRGTTEGNQLKTETGWHNGGNGSNLYGFDLVPAGARGTSGQYDNAGRNGYLWTSTSPQENSAFYRRIEAGNSQIARGSYVYVEGYPARCLKDTE